jgi:hypothetical protein
MPSLNVSWSAKKLPFFGRLLRSPFCHHAHTQPPPPPPHPSQRYTPDHPLPLPHTHTPAISHCIHDVVTTGNTVNTVTHQYGRLVTYRSTINIPGTVAIIPVTFSHVLRVNRCGGVGSCVCVCWVRFKTSDFHTKLCVPVGRLVDEHGTMELSETLAPATNLARNGFPMYQSLHNSIQSGASRLRRFQASTETFLVNGEAPPVGKLHSFLMIRFRVVTEKGMWLWWWWFITTFITTTTRLPWFRSVDSGLEFCTS